MSMRRYIPLFALALAIGLTIAVPIHTALAQQTTQVAPPTVSGCGPISFFSRIPTCLVGWASIALNSIFAYFLGLFLSLSTMLVGFALQFNYSLLTPPPAATANTLVYIGWGITRDIANLGFVLATVVIAIATIIRVESYGYKKLLPKLIAAAILVNFSLAIAGVLIDFSHVLTNFFFSKIDADSSPAAIASAIGGAFQPQQFYILPGAGSALDSEGDVTGIGTFSATLLNAIASLLFTNVFMLLAIFVMLVFGMLLLLRYLWLSFLLILAPLVWLFWVVPALSGQFHKWWSRFIEWTFFAPAAAFFMYLALASLNGLNAAAGAATAQSSAFGSIGASLILLLNKGAQMTVLVGVMLGGLIVAKSMGVSAAGAAVGLAQKAGKGARAWAGRKSLQYASAPLRRRGEGEEAKTGAERVQAWAQTRKSAFGRAAAGFIARGTTRFATAGGEDVVRHHEGQVAKMGDTDATAAVLTASGPRLIALLKKLQQAGKLGDIDMTRVATKENRALFARFNQGKVFSDVEKGGLMNVEMNDARARGDWGAYESAANGLLKNFTRADAEKASFKDMFSGKPKFGLDAATLNQMGMRITRALATTSHQLVPSIIPKLDTNTRDNFTTKYQNGIETRLRLLSGLPRTPENTKSIQTLNTAKEAFEKTMANYSIGFAPAPEPGTTTAPTGAPAAGGPPPGGPAAP